MQDTQNAQKPLSERQIRRRRAKLRRVIARKRAFKRPLEHILIELGQIPVRKCGGVSGAW